MVLKRDCLTRITWEVSNSQSKSSGCLPRIPSSSSLVGGTLGGNRKASQEMPVCSQGWGPLSSLFLIYLAVRRGGILFQGPETQDHYRKLTTKRSAYLNVEPEKLETKLAETLWVNSVQFSSVQSLSCVWLFATPSIAARQASLSITNSRSLLKLMPIESVMPSSYLILCRPLLLLPPIPPSISVFSNESTLRMRWPKYWSFRFSIN